MATLLAFFKLTSSSYILLSHMLHRAATFGRMNWVLRLPLDFVAMWLAIYASGIYQENCAWSLIIARFDFSFGHSGIIGSWHQALNSWLCLNLIWTFEMAAFAYRQHDQQAMKNLCCSLGAFRRGSMRHACVFHTIPFAGFVKSQRSCAYCYLILWFNFHHISKQ